VRIVLAVVVEPSGDLVERDQLDPIWKALFPAEQARITAPMHHLTPELLAWAFHQLKSMALRRAVTTGSRPTHP
jgi:hypothetical protein